MSDSLWMLTIEGIKAVVQGLSLSGLSNHYLFKKPWNTGVTHPAAFYFPVPEKIQTVTNAQDDYALGVQVSFTQVSNRDVDSNMDRLLLWRQTAMRAFHGKRLSGVSGVYLCQVEPGPVFDDSNFVANFDVTSFVVRALARIVR